MSCRTLKSILHPLALLCIFFPAACATVPVHLNAIPPLPPSAKLRVYVQPLTGYGTWTTPHGEFAAWTVNIVERYLKETGIYEVVSAQDVRTVLNDRAFTSHQMRSNDWRLAKEIGRALRADYVMILERNIGGAMGGFDFSIDNIMINIETGKKYKSSYGLNRITRYDRDRVIELIKTTHRDIFRSAKQDMLATAIKKGNRLEQTKESTAVSPAPAPRPSPAVPQTPAPTSQTLKQTPATTASDSAKGTRLAVFDIDAPENYRPVALILTESLREELFLLKKFILVNREDLQQVLQENALQQTGLIDEKQAVKTGKGMAANQVVTGRLGLLGKTYVLQAKRIDVETFATLGLTSTKFKEGQEDEVLSRMKDLAKSLSGL